MGQLASAIGVHKSTAYRILASLERAGLVSCDTLNGRYYLGLEIVAMSGVVLGQSTILRAADPHIQQLADKTKLTVNLTIRHQNLLLPLQQIPGSNVVRNLDWLSKRIPLHRGAAAMALLAYLNDEEIKAYLQSTNEEGTEPASPSIWDEISEIRELEYAVNRGENKLNVYAVAVPIFGANGAVCASLSIAGHREHFSEERIVELARSASEAALIISGQLGYDNPVSAQIA